MGTRQADSEALVARCKKIGWHVEMGAKGYKVVDATGRPHSVHLTYSSRNSLGMITRQLDAAGLTDTEKAIANSRQTESRSRNDIARQAADELGKRMAAKTNVSRAAGPYLTEAEDVPLNWFIDPHPAPWMRWANITPDIAAKILADHNADNRPVNPATVTFYTNVIVAGLWHLTHQGFAFDTRGMLQDGQHRMSAIVEAGKLSVEPVIVPAAVFVGMPVENFKAIDEGLLRTARQLFGKDGEKNTSTLQTCIRLSYCYLDGDVRKNSRLKLPNQTLVDEFGKDPDGFRTSANFGQSKYAKVWSSGAALAAAHYLIRKANGADNTYVDQFFDGLVTGLIPGTRTVLDDDDPRQAYRSKMQGRYDRRREGGKVISQLSAISQLGMIIQTWNSTAAGRSIRQIPFTEATPIPHVALCIPGEGACPKYFTPHKEA